MHGPIKMAKAVLARRMAPTKMASNLMVRRREIADNGLQKANAPEETLVLGEARIRRPKLGPEPEARATKRAKARAKKVEVKALIGSLRVTEADLEQGQPPQMVKSAEPHPVAKRIACLAFSI